MRQAIVLWAVAGLMSAAGLACTRQDADRRTLDEQLAAARDIQLKEGPRAAIPVMEGALNAARASGSRAHEGLALGHLGTAYKNLGDYTRATEFHERALRIKRALGDEPEIAKTLNNIGLVEEARGNCGEALGLYSQSLDIFNRLGLPRFAASVLNNRGLCHDALGSYRQSLADYGRALQLHRQAGNEIGESEALGNIGGVQLLLGRFADAVVHYEASLAISTRLDLQQSMALDHINLGLARVGTGDIGAAKAHLERAKALATRGGLLREQADAARGLSLWHERTGDYDGAARALGEAAAAYERAGLSRERADADRDRGDLALATGDLARAGVAFGRSMTAATALGYHAGRLQARLSIARLDLRRNHLEAAAAGAAAVREDAQSAEDWSTAASGATLLARVRLAENRATDAVKAAEDALANARRTASDVLQAQALLATGDSSLAAGAHRRARSSFDAALKLAPTDLLPALAWRARFGRGRAMEAGEQLERALADYRAAVDIIESVRSRMTSARTRTGYLDDKRQVYSALVRLLLRLGRARAAFDAAERLRANGYVEMISRSAALGTWERGRPSGSALARLTQLQRALEDELARGPADQRGQAVALYRDDLRSAEEDWNRAVESLVRTDHRAVALRAGTLPSVPDIQQRLASDAALVQFVVDSDRTVAFVLTRTAFRARLLPVGGRILRPRIELLRALLRRTESDSWHPPAERLDDELLGPLRAAGWLRDVRHLYVVPHADLNYLPFAVLRRQTSAGPRLLIQDVSISMLPAATALVLEPARREPRADLLAMAPARPRLPFAREEVEALGRLFPENSLVVGATASEERFKRDAGQFRILHLATHGFFNRVNPLFSAVDLERAGADDGRLQVYEILGMSLAADLVTLSACDTALGAGELADLPAGEELVGLTRAFLSAGSGHVLATLWDVSDRATASLMTEFYEALRSRPAAQALADVQRNWAGRPGADGHPYYWAPFVLTGGGRGGNPAARSVGSLQEPDIHAVHP